VKRGAFSDEAMQIAFVDYDMPGPNRMPWSAAPDRNGNYWVPYYGRANMVGMLDPKTGKVREFRAPFPETAAIHSAVPAPDGSVWFTEQGSNRLGRIDPRTGEVGEFQAPLKDGIGTERGSRHTVRVDSEGIVWSTGSPFTRFDPKTGEFHQFAEIPTSYGVTLASDGAVWFTEFTQDGKVGKVDPKTLKVTKYALPTPNARPRRMQVDTDGTIWFAEYAAGKIGRLDPQTGAIKEYSLPGASPTPYALGIDKDRNVWYSSMDMDVIGRLNPNTGAVTEFPFPYSENGMREFHLDEQGRMWFASPPNNKVGYFVLQAAR
jgi:virginiamycin B lyase